MSSDETPNVPARRDRREAVREKAAQVQAQQRRRRTIRTTVISVVVAALVVGAGSAVAWTLISSASKPQLLPTGLTGDAVVVETLPASVLASFSGASAGPVASEDPAVAGDGTPVEPSAAPTPAPLEIAVYVDYLSQASADFEMANAKQLSDWVSQGAATISYHPVALLTAKSNGTKYSLRAASAGACVATHSPESFFSFNHELLAKKPAMDTDGHSDSELAALAIAVGSGQPKALRACIEGGDFVPWVQQATERALREPLGNTGVPLAGATVLVNGIPYVGAVGDPKEFAQFVLTLASDAYYSTPTPTPVPSGAPASPPAP